MKSLSEVEILYLSLEILGSMKIGGHRITMMAKNTYEQMHTFTYTSSLYLNNNAEPTAMCFHTFVNLDKVRANISQGRNSPA